MKLKKEFFILIGIILILVVFLILSGNRNRMKYRIPKLETLNQEEVDKIEIEKGEQKIVLAAREDGWKLLPKEYPVEKTKVDDMLEVITGLTLTELASEKEDYTRYELDEDKKISVKTYKGDKLIRSFDVGKTSSTYSHTYVRLDKNKRVFHARNSFRSTFDQELEDLRDKHVMTFDKNEISKILLTGGELEEELFLEKKAVPVEPPPGETEPLKEEEKPEEEKTEAEKPAEEKPAAPSEEDAWLLADGTQAKKTEINSLLTHVSDLSCDSFIEDKTKEDFSTPLFTLVLTGNKEYTLKIFDKGEDENAKYPALSSESPYPFWLTKYSAERVMKKKDDLFEKPKEEKEG
ncbi:MAG: DUF4340 domain-containing protein [Candidatus Aminicenantes bacterium]|nr:DUF4340 domain-containing protein [Candidatus Aminicenantes bacterium]